MPISYKRKNSMKKSKSSKGSKSSKLSKRVKTRKSTKTKKRLTRKSKNGSVVRKMRGGIISDSLKDDALNYDLAIFLNNYNNNKNATNKSLLTIKRGDYYFIVEQKSYKNLYEFFHSFHKNHDITTKQLNKMFESINFKNKIFINHQGTTIPFDF